MTHLGSQVISIETFSIHNICFTTCSTDLSTGNSSKCAGLSSYRQISYCYYPRNKRQVKLWLAFMYAKCRSHPRVNWGPIESYNAPMPLEPPSAHRQGWYWPFYAVRLLRSCSQRKQIKLWSHIPICLTISGPFYWFDLSWPWGHRQNIAMA